MLAVTTSASAVATVCKRIRMLKPPRQMHSVRLSSSSLRRTTPDGIDIAVSKKEWPEIQVHGASMLTAQDPLDTATELEQPLWRIARHTAIYPKEKRIAAEIPLARAHGATRVPRRRCPHRGRSRRGVYARHEAKLLDGCRAYEVHARCTSNGPRALSRAWS